MSDDANPYQSPAGEVPSLWRQVVNWFQAPSEKFEQGAPLIKEGIQFFVDPENQRALFAASPSAEVSQRKLDLVISEVKRVVPVLIEEYPGLRQFLGGREIYIRLIDTYDNGKPQSRDCLMSLGESAKLLKVDLDN